LCDDGREREEEVGNITAVSTLLPALATSPVTTQAMAATPS